MSVADRDFFALPFDYNGEEFTALIRAHIEWMIRLCRERNVRRSIETGFGLGISASSLLHFGVIEHVAIECDKSRINVARRNIEMVKSPDQAFCLIEGGADMWLPKLAGGNKFDLMLIDGGHRFDDVFIDVHYARKLLRHGGVILLDDVWMESIQAVIRWIESNLPHIWERLEPPEGLAAGYFSMAAFTLKPEDGGYDHDPVRPWNFHRAF